MTSRIAATRKSPVFLWLAVPPTGDFHFGFGDKAYNFRMSALLRKKWDTLFASLRGRSRLLVAFSGGCDSSFLLAAALKTLGRDHVLAVTAVSPSLPAHEKDFTRQMAERWSADYLAIDTDELSNPS